MVALQRGWLEASHPESSDPRSALHPSNISGPHPTGPSPQEKRLSRLRPERRRVSLSPSSQVCSCPMQFIFICLKMLP